MQSSIVYAVTLRENEGTCTVTLFGYGMHGLLASVSALLEGSGRCADGFSVSDSALSVSIKGDSCGEVYRLLCQSFIMSQGQRDGSI